MFTSSPIASKKSGALGADLRAGRRGRRRAGALAREAQDHGARDVAAHADDARDVVGVPPSALTVGSPIVTGSWSIVEKTFWMLVMNGVM
jgi:hypothetical protein